MKIESSFEPNIDRLDLIESQFYPAALTFIDAKRRDERDSSMNKDFVALRKSAAERVNMILDQYLDLRALADRATPLNPGSA